VHVLARDFDGAVSTKGGRPASISKSTTPRSRHRFDRRRRRPRLFGRKVCRGTHDRTGFSEMIFTRHRLRDAEVRDFHLTVG